MAYVRRHWFASTLYVLILFAALAIWLTPTIFSEGTLEEVRAQAAEPQPIDPYLYTRVQSLRRTMALTNNDLAAMGCTEESARLILETLRNWAMTHKNALDQQHRDELRARAALREAIRLNNTGQSGSRPETPLPELQRDLALLYGQSRTRLDSLVAQVEARLDASQLKIWQSARANIGLSAPFHYVPDMTDQQRQSIHDQLTDRSSQASLGDVRESELAWSQKQASDTARTNIPQRIREVRDAEAEVLSIPEMFVEPSYPIEEPPL